MTKDSWILFTDLDGTLLNDKKEITKTDREGIYSALARGHKVVIATGRPLASAILLATELGLTVKGCYIIAFNGGLIYDCGSRSTIYKQTMPLSRAKHLLDEAYNAGIHAHTYSKHHVLCEHDTETLHFYEKSIKLSAIVTDNICNYLTYDPMKVVLIDRNSKQKLLDFQSHMASWCEGYIDSIFSSDFMLEYTAAGSNKGNAVIRLCNLLNIPIAHSIAAGDAQNDISMLDAAGIGAVMANGTEEAKAHAQFITSRDNNHGGIAEIIETFLL